MRDEWELQDVIASWTLDESDWKLLANKTGATRLGFALLLKFFDLEGRFPARPEELPAAAVDYVAGLVKVPAAELTEYAWSGRTIEYHRAQVRAARGFREATGGDEQRMIEWLAAELCPVELSVDRLRDDLLARFRDERIEPPGPSRIERILGSGRSLFSGVSPRPWRSAYRSRRSTSLSSSWPPSRTGFSRSSRVTRDGRG